MYQLSKTGHGTYVSATFTQDTVDTLVELQKSLQLLNPTPPNKFHTTICYSRVHVPYIASNESTQVSCCNHLELWDTKSGKTLVLMLDDAEWMHKRHELANILGATYDFDEYKPHITLSYDVGGQWVDIDKKVDINIVVEREHVELLDLEWTPN